MHKLLQKLLQNKGISSPEELDNSPMPDGSPTERQVFEEYRRVLSKDELTLEDIKEFCKTQIQLIETKWSDFNLDNSLKAQYIPYHTVYSILLNAIDSPKSLRESAERQLTQLTK